MNEFVSVVIPTYNSLQTIERAVNSVLNQTRKCFQIILIDDCSTDGTYEHLVHLRDNLKFDGEIILGRNEINSGPSITRNKGINLATGDWIAFLDSDDHWHPQKNEMQLYIAQKFSCSFIGTKTKVSSESELHSLKANDLKLLTLSPSSFYWRNYFQTPSVIIRNSDSVIFDSKMRYAEDYDLWMKLVNKYNRAILIENELTYIGKHPYSTSGLSSNLYSMEKGELSVLSKIPHIIPRYLSLLLSILKFIRRLVIVALPARARN